MLPAIRSVMVRTKKSIASERPGRLDRPCLASKPSTERCSLALARLRVPRPFLTSAPDSWPRHQDSLFHFKPTVYTVALVHEPTVTLGHARSLATSNNTKTQIAQRAASPTRRQVRVPTFRTGQPKCFARRSTIYDS